MAKPLVSDAFWKFVEPLLPPPKPRRWRFPGRKPLDQRMVLTGIIFVLRTGIPWEALPQEMGCGSGMSCLNYLKAWHRAGVWQKLHGIALQELEEAERIDWSRGTVDASLCRAFGGGDSTGKNPTDRGKLGSKHHAETDGGGIPLNVTTTAANVPEVNELEHLVDSAPKVVTQEGEVREHPDELYGDRAYDSEPHRERMREHGIDPHFARRRTEHGSHLGVFRWVAERTIAWLHSFRRLRFRTDRNDQVHDAFVKLASAIICCWFL
jgi:transposase